MFFVYHGPDELTRSEAVTKLRADKSSGDAANDELNTSWLDGQWLTLGQLQEACSVFSLFGNQQRLVIVDNYLTRLKSEKSSKIRKDALEALGNYLETLPESTVLIFVEKDTLPTTHPTLKLAQKQSGSGYARAFEGQRKGEWTQWIVERVRNKGATIELAAARALAEAVGGDPKHANASNVSRLLDSEIEKLIIYAGGENPKINSEDIELLVPYTGQANIFTMVDAIGRRNSKIALQELHGLYDDDPAQNHPLRLLAMIVRQFRILIQVKELAGQGLPNSTIAKRTGLPAFVAEKTKHQAMNFSMTQLETIYARLFETDLAIKSGLMEDILALDTLVAALCGPQD